MFLGQLFGLQGFLSLLSPTSLLGLPVLLMNIITPNRVQWSLNYQYPALVYPFLLVGAAEGLARIRRWIGRTSDQRPVKNQARHTTANADAATPLTKRRGWRSPRTVQSIGMVILLLIAVVANVNLTMSYSVCCACAKRRNAWRRQTLCSLMYHPTLRWRRPVSWRPHLAQRERLYFFPGNGSYPAEYIDRAEYIAADSRPPGGNKDVINLLTHIHAEPRWELVAQEGDFVLLRQR